jgi:hypothetical protein
MMDDATNLTRLRKHTVEDFQRDRRWLTRKIALTRSAEVRDLCRRLQALPSWGEVETVQLFFPYRSNFHLPGFKDVVGIEIVLAKGTDNAQLPRDIIRAGLAASLKKEKAWDSRSLSVSGVLLDTPQLTVTLAIEGYLPQSCRVEYEEVAVPARVEQRARIVCNPATSPQGLDESAVEGTITAESLGNVGSLP